MRFKGGCQGVEGKLSPTLGEHTTTDVVIVCFNKHALFLPQRYKTSSICKKFGRENVGRGCRGQHSPHSDSTMKRSG